MLVIEGIRGRFARAGLTAAQWLSVGVGDDAAVMRSSERGCDMVVSCDLFLEGVHFLPRFHAPEQIGYKALARATSDLAAIGARPKFFLLSLALPKVRTGTWLNGFSSGLLEAALEYHMVLAGGDTSEFSSAVANITVGGEVRSGHALTRSGARPGDQIFVSGTLGAAQLGLEIVLSGLVKDAAAARSAISRSLLGAHLYPRPRIELGAWLAGGRRGGHRIASAAIDTSDGLSTDLRHICEASKVGARIWAGKLPSVNIPAEVAKRLARTRQASGGGRFRPDAVEMALHGGEDYQLLFTVPAKFAAQIPAAYRGVGLSNIGEITRRRGIEVVDSSGKASRLQPRGWDPFR